jgi:hypothetical protein
MTPGGLRVARMKSALSLIVLAAAAFAECRTPLGQPCYTIEFRQSQWILFHRGVTDFQHSSLRRTHAVRGDGSVWGTSEQSGFSLVRGVASGSMSTSMYLAPQDRVIRIFPADRTFSSRVPLIWHDRPYRRSAAGDALCVTGIRHNGTDFRHAGTAAVLGIPVQRWMRSLGNGGGEDIWLAPELDCLALKREAVYRNHLRLPTLIDSMEMVSVRWGEPDPQLFRIPPGYREVSDPSLPRLREFVRRANPR